MKVSSVLLALSSSSTRATITINGGSGTPISVALDTPLSFAITRPLDFGANGQANVEDNFTFSNIGISQVKF